MNGLNERERRLLFVFGALLLILGVYLVFLRGSDTVTIPDLFPTPAPTEVSPAVSPVSPVFTIPPGARDPFGGGGPSPTA